MIVEGLTYGLRGLSAKLQQELKAPLSPPLIQCPPQKTCMTCGPINKPVRYQILAYQY